MADAYKDWRIFLEEFYWGEIICVRLGFDWEELGGKTVLDIGAGRGEFALAGANHGVEIVSVDNKPRMAEANFLALKNGIRTGDAKEMEKVRDKYQQIAKDLKPRKTKYVEADATALPFEDEQFDVVVSHAGPPACNIQTENEARLVVEEMIRVLKVGGECRIAPGLEWVVFCKDNPNYDIHDYAKSLKLLRSIVSEATVVVDKERDVSYFKFSKDDGPNS